MSHQPATAAKHPGSVTSYTIGFLLSIILTVIPYMLVTRHLADGWTLVIGLLVFAVAQLMVQLMFFLHLGNEARPWWNIQAFIFAVFVVLVVVVGSIWIMYHLNYNMTGHDQSEYIIKDEGIGSPE
jgi:cytochrome o ubiquinol oxidase operon protein cyoD